MLTHTAGSLLLQTEAQLTHTSETARCVPTATVNTQVRIVHTLVNICHTSQHKC